MIEKIPSQEIFVCDVCETRNAPWKANCQIVVNQHALDHLGDPAANGSFKLDVCDNCRLPIFDVINDAVKKIRNEKEL